MPAEENAHAHVVVSGRVQGVYFRASTAQEARSLGIAGWVRNTGSDVEAEFEGPRHLVEQMIAWCHSGPPRAMVDSVIVKWGVPEGLTGFSVR